MQQPDILLRGAPKRIAGEPKVCEDSTARTRWTTWTGRTMTEAEAVFRRSEEPFFHSGESVRFAHQIAKQDSLIFYCGAGVTIDRTGLGWSDLISSIYPADDKGAKADEPTSDELETLRQHEDPMRLASALTYLHHGRHSTTDEVRAEVTPRLQMQLYSRNGWQAGRLSRNLALLALGAAALGKRVTIVTTNYDTYIEQALYDQQRNLVSSEMRVEPSIRVRLAGRETFHKGRKVDPNAPLVDLLYLHGRVHKEGLASGRIVISEVDYAATRSQTVGELQTLFKGKGTTAVVTLGASLTDPPLIEALVATREEPNRFAVMPLESMGYTKFGPAETPRLSHHMKKRGTLLGVDIVATDFKSQVAQFCSEILHEMTTEDHAECGRDVPVSAYSVRLKQWWASWSRSSRSNDYDTTYRELRDELDEVKRIVQQQGGPDRPATEKFRLELWVRVDPSSKSRHLALWGSSVGPIHDRSRLRVGEIALHSRNASVTSFTEGRAVHLSTADLELRPQTVMDERRWNSYLSLPIYVNVGGTGVPVGAITLASSSTEDDSALPLRDAMDMTRLSETLLGVGRRLLSIDDAEEPR